MGRTYRHLTLRERQLIFRMLDKKVSMRAIAEKLGKHISTIYREIKRNWFDDMDPWLDGYYGEAADQMAKGRRTKLRKMVANPQLASLVIEKLKEAWSPEQIAGHLRVVSQSTDAAVSKISHETIYRYVYDKTGRALDLYRHLPTGRRRRRRRYDRKPRGLLIPQANTIAYRPDVINERQRLGDWECDLVQFRKEFGNANLTTIVERKTRLLVIVRNPSRHSEGVMKGIKSKLGPYPAHARRSITFDRGSEFANYSYLKSEIGAEGYFCKPQAPWQKGTNENTNGRMRRFLPRETDLATVTDAQLQAIADKMNATPRKCLGFIAPNEAFSRLLTVENAS